MQMISDLSVKMEIKKDKIILFLIFLLAFGFRLIFLFRIPFFSSDETYFHLRHSKYILENFLPLIYDPQSYGGNIVLHTHIFHYFLSFFDLLFSDIVVYKILPAILASSIVIIIYYFIKDITKNDFAALFGALLAAFIPSYIAMTLNQVSVLSIFIPLLLLGLYFFLEIKDKQKWFLYFSIILILLDPLNLLMLFTLFTFALLTYAESLGLKKEEKEGIGFFIVFFILVNLILYKSLYLKQGITAIWQNLPLELYGQIFQNFNIFDTINSIGFIPLILGIMGLLLYREKNRTITLLRAILIADFTLLLLRLIPFQEGILFMAVILCITAGISMNTFIHYFRLTKFARLEKIVLSTFIILTVISLVIPSVSVATELIYTAESLIKAKRALDSYGVDYIYFSEKTQEFYGVESLVYTSDESCFKEVYKNEFATIYQVVC